MDTPSIKDLMRENLLLKEQLTQHQATVEGLQNALTETTSKVNDSARQLRILYGGLIYYLKRSRWLHTIPDGCERLWVEHEPGWIPAQRALSDAAKERRTPNSIDLSTPYNPRKQIRTVDGETVQPLDSDTEGIWQPEELACRRERHETSMDLDPPNEPG